MWHGNNKKNKRQGGRKKRYQLLVFREELIEDKIKTMVRRQKSPLKQAKKGRVRQKKEQLLELIGGYLHVSLLVCVYIKVDKAFESCFDYKA